MKKIAFNLLLTACLFTAIPLSNGQNTNDDKTKNNNTNTDMNDKTNKNMTDHKNMNDNDMILEDKNNTTKDKSGSKEKNVNGTSNTGTTTMNGSTKMSGVIPEDDQKFIKQAAESGMFEVQISELAQTTATSTQVKEYAKTMVSDHTKANNELKALAKRKNVTIPTTMSDKMRKKYTDLTEKKGDDFDKEYMEMMVKEHKDDIDAFQKEADKGKDPEVKAWASEKLPTLKHHLQMAESIQDVVHK